MSAQQPVVDENGDLFLHGRQGLELVIEFQNADGTPRDVSAAEMTFEVGPSVNETLTPVPGNIDQLQLTLSNDDVKAIFAENNKEFVFIDHSAPQPTPFWVGVVYPLGWTE